MGKDYKRNKKRNAKRAVVGNMRFNNKKIVQEQKIFWVISPKNRKDKENEKTYCYSA